MCKELLRLRIERRMDDWVLPGQLGAAVVCHERFYDLFEEYIPTEDGAQIDLVFYTYEPPLTEIGHAVRLVEESYARVLHVDDQYDIPDESAGEYAYKRFRKAFAEAARAAGLTPEHAVLWVTVEDPAAVAGPVAGPVA